MRTKPDIGPGEPPERAAGRLGVARPISLLRELEGAVSYQQVQISSRASRTESDVAGPSAISGSRSGRQPAAVDLVVRSAGWSSGCEAQSGRRPRTPNGGLACVHDPEHVEPAVCVGDAEEIAENRDVAGAVACV
jgi:hypothetical protein